MRIAIVEDEVEAQRTLQQCITQWAQRHHCPLDVDIFSDGTEILPYHAHYDIIFLDIMMPSTNGMETAQHIRTLDNDVIIIFVTNMVNYAIQGYKVSAMDYIVKPITDFALHTSLDRAYRVLQARDHADYLTINSTSGLQKIAIRDIITIETKNHYCTFTTTAGNIRAYLRLRDIESTLDAISSAHFFRINKGTLVNLAFVDHIYDDNCAIRGQIHPVSHSRRRAFMHAVTEAIQQE